MTALMNPVSAHLAYVLSNPDVNAAFGFHPKRVLWDNPGAFKPRRATALTVVFLVGLTMSRFPKKKGRDQKTTAQAVRKFLMEKKFSGGSIILQLGWWSKTREDSVKVVLENRDTGLSDGEFRTRVKEAILEALKKFGQYEIYVDFFRGSRRVGKPMTAYWKP